MIDFSCAKFTGIRIVDSSWWDYGKCCGIVGCSTANKWWPIWFRRWWHLLRRLGWRKGTWSWRLYGTKASGRIFGRMELRFWSVRSLYLAKVITIHTIICSLAVFSARLALLSLIYYLFMTVRAITSTFLTFSCSLSLAWSAFAFEEPTPFCTELQLRYDDYANT